MPRGQRTANAAYFEPGTPDFLNWPRVEEEEKEGQPNQERRREQEKRSACYARWRHSGRILSAEASSSLLKNPVLHQGFLCQGMALQSVEKATNVCATVEERPFRAV